MERPACQWRLRNFKELLLGVRMASFSHRQIAISSYVTAMINAVYSLTISVSTGFSLSHDRLSRGGNETPSPQSLRTELDLARCADRHGADGRCRRSLVIQSIRDRNSWPSGGGHVLCLRSAADQERHRAAGSRVRRRSRAELGGIERRLPGAGRDSCEGELGVLG